MKDSANDPEKYNELIIIELQIFYWNVEWMKLPNEYDQEDYGWHKHSQDMTEDFEYILIRNEKEGEIRRLMLTKTWPTAKSENILKLCWWKIKEDPCPNQYSLDIYMASILVYYIILTDIFEKKEKIEDILFCSFFFFLLFFLFFM